MRNFAAFLAPVLLTFSSFLTLNCLDVDFKMSQLERNTNKHYATYRAPSTVYYNYGVPVRYEKTPNSPRVFNNSIENLSARIAGGDFIDIEDVPYQVSIQYNNKHICGGAIISKNHVLTAAHCTIGLETEKVTIRAGSSHDSVGGVVKNAKCIFNHIGYSYLDPKYDVALIKLKDPLTFSEGIQPVPLIDQCAPPIPPGRQAFVSGWGNLQQDKPNSEHTLRALILHIQEGFYCKVLHNWFQPEYMICAGEVDGIRDICKGDSGGPLTIDGVLVGIVADDKYCAVSGVGAIYTSVAKVRGFIEYMMLL